MCEREVKENKGLARKKVEFEVQRGVNRRMFDAVSRNRGGEHGTRCSRSIRWWAR